MGACRIPRPTDPTAAARAELVQLLFDYVERLRDHFERTAQAHDLTPVQAKVILGLDQPEPMHRLAASLGCDPSNVTGVVDRLEERGLLERVESPEDRRVKMLRATDAGKKMQAAFAAALFRDVPGMDALRPDEAAALRAALVKLTG